MLPLRVGLNRVPGEVAELSKLVLLEHGGEVRSCRARTLRLRYPDARSTCEGHEHTVGRRIIRSKDGAV